MSMKGSNVKFHENPFSRSGVVPCGRKEGKMDGRAMDSPTGMTELMVDFCNFANAPKIDISMEILAVTCREMFTKKI